MRDPMAIVPLTVNRAEWKALRITEKLVEDVALSTSGLRSTFVFGGFDKIHITPKAGSSMVARNKKTNRISLFMNEKFVKRVVLGAMVDRSPYDPALGSRRNTMGEDAGKFVYGPATFPVAHAIKGILLHEFAHVWFSHLEYMAENTKSEDERWLCNLVQDALLNHHCNVPPFLSDLLPLSHPDQAVFSLTHIDWAVATGWGNTRAPAKVLLEMFSGCSKAELEDPKFGRELDNYRSWRSLVALMQVVKKGTRVSTLVKWVLEYAGAIVTYDLKIEEIGAMVGGMFPDLVKKTPNLPDHNLPAIKRGQAPPACSYPGPGKPAPGHADENQAGPEKPEAKQEPDETEPDEEHVDDEFERDEPFEFEGQEFEPVKRSELSPEFLDKIPEILSSIGEDAGVGEDLTRFYKKTSDMSISQKTRNAVLKAAAKNLVRVSKQVLHLKPKASSISVTIVPNRHPLYSDLAKESALLLDTDPRYKRVLRSSEECRSAKVAMFIDVSGSTGDVWEKIMGFAKSLSKLCSLQVFQFSTRIVPISLSDLSAGAVITTGGTDGNCIVEKMVELSSTIESFVVLGDRHYGAQNSMRATAKTIRIMDVAVNGGLQYPWFRNSAHASVYYVNLNSDFEVIKEGGASDIAQDTE